MSTSQFPRLISQNLLGSDILFPAARMMKMLDESAKTPKYPPYNLEKHDNGEYKITLAVSGFTKDELSVEVKEEDEVKLLIVRGEKAESDNDSESIEYMHKGIGMRNFVREFRAGKFLETSGVNLADGLLTITLNQVEREKPKPKLLKINAKRF